MQPGLTIVSNRLPVSVKKTEGKLEFYPSVGGLATGLSSYADNKRNKWIGWPGITNEELTEQDRSDITTELKKHNCYPVFLTKSQIDNFYGGYSNSVLWPLFHDLPLKAKLDEAHWRAYKKVNALFAEAVLARSHSGSTVWVHDYQLLLLPGLLRAERPQDKIGFFLHIPFPGLESFSLIPHSKELISGLLGSDLIGFHTKGYVENFLSAVGAIDPSLLSSQGEVLLPSRIVRVTDFPMGIDYGKFSRAAKLSAVKRELFKLRNKYRGKKVILTVDRLDPTKGLVERLAAYQMLLRTNPKLHRKVVMIMIAVPSRTEIDEYKDLRKRLEKLVKAVNKEFGTLRWTPVEYLYTSFPYQTLSAYYQLADVAFIAPVRDGMNLVAKEYIASRPGKNGVLILSDTAGAAAELKDAVIVDPHKRASLVEGLTSALTMPTKELKQRATSMQKQISEFTVQEWAGSFMDSLKKASPAEHMIKTHNLDRTRQRELSEAFKRSHHRLLLLDYDGVLVPFVNNPYKAIPSEKLTKAIQTLAEQPGTDIVVVSGRSKADLLEWFADLPVGLAAEHGAYVRLAGKKRWQSMGDSDDAWQDIVLPIVEEYTAKTPGAAIETKSSSVVWHYRRASAYYAHKHLVILKRILGRFAKKYGYMVRQGNMILEIRKQGFSKGAAIKHWLKPDTSFVLCIGDDYTDEDMFENLPDWAHTVKVGRGRTAARLRLQKPHEVVSLLEKLAR